MIRGEYKTKGSKPTHGLMWELWRLNGKKVKATQSNTIKQKNNAEQPQWNQTTRWGRAREKNRKQKSTHYIVYQMLINGLRGRILRQCKCQPKTKNTTTFRFFFFFLKKALPQFYTPTFRLKKTLQCHENTLPCLD